MAGKTKDFIYRAMIDNTTQIRTVSNFAEMMIGQNVYAKECNSNHSVLAVHMKNWEPFVLGPAFAIDRIPGPVCFNSKFSSLNFRP